MFIKAKNRTLELTVPVVMGILNATPDSFSDGAPYSLEQLLLKADCFVKEGAKIIDVGGESTRPGWKSISIQQEIDRVCPLIEAISENIDVMISVDTYKPKVMEAALHSGAHVVNDITGLRDPLSIRIASETNAAVCIMHMNSNLENMHEPAVEKDIFDDVKT